MQQDPRNFGTPNSAFPNGQAPFDAPQSGAFEPPANNGQNVGRGYPFDDSDFFGDTGEFQQATFERAAGVEEYKAVRRKNGLLTVVFTFAVLCAAVLILNASVFKLRSIRVEGVADDMAGSVAEAAGISLGQSFLSIDEGKVKKNINENRYLEYQGMVKHFPNAVTLTVRARQQCANMMVMGVMYILDEEGMVLEKSNSVKLDNGLLTVTGMQAREIRVGMQLIPQKTEQLTCYSVVLNELIAQNYADQISELNLSNVDNLYLVTVDGYTLSIGSAEDIRAKLGTARGVVEKLRELGKTGGLIEASVPGAATYSPSNV